VNSFGLSPGRKYTFSKVSENMGEGKESEFSLKEMLAIVAILVVAFVVPLIVIELWKSLVKELVYAISSTFSFAGGLVLKYILDVRREKEREKRAEFKALYYHDLTRLHDRLGRIKELVENLIEETLHEKIGNSKFDSHTKRIAGLLLYVLEQFDRMDYESAVYFLSKVNICRKINGKEFSFKQVVCRLASFCEELGIPKLREVAEELERAPRTMKKELYAEERNLKESILSKIVSDVKNFIINYESKESSKKKVDIEEYLVKIDPWTGEALGEGGLTRYLLLAWFMLDPLERLSEVLYEEYKKRSP